MRLKRWALGLALAPAVALAGCAYDDYGYGGVNVGYGSGGYYDPWYDGYYGYPAYGWYNGFYYPGHGYWIYDRRGHRHRWSNDQRRHWEGRRHGDRDHAGKSPDRPDRLWRGDRSPGDRSGWKQGREHSQSGDAGARPDRQWREGRSGGGDRSASRQFRERSAVERAAPRAMPRSAPEPRAERPSGGGMRGWAARVRGDRD